MDLSSGQFGGQNGDDNSMFNGGDDSGMGQFPSIGDMFSQMGDNDDDSASVDTFVRKARARNASRVIDVGLHFYGRLNHKK